MTLKKRRVLLGYPHGKNSSYTAGCRCEDCTKARSDYGRAARARKKEEA